jgi:hypothetical protein
MQYDKSCALDMLRRDKKRIGICRVPVIEPWVGNSSLVTLIPFRLQKHGKGVDLCSNNEPRSFVKIW